jgi:hypothetical protein
MPFIRVYPFQGKPWLLFDEVLDRVRACFEHVNMDRESGREFVAKTLRLLQAFDNTPAESIKKARGDLEQAVMVTAWNGDDCPEDGVQFVWQPGEMLFIRYAKGARRQATKLCKALDYQLDDG